MNKKKKVKKHKHKWETALADCILCGGGEYEECECGEARDVDSKKPL